MKTHELFDYDKSFGVSVAGIDEAGRGPLAGPVVCACAVMGDCYIEGINDSKKLSESKREKLYQQIIAGAKGYAIALADVGCIDEVNILQATKQAMANAYKNLSVEVDLVIVDAVKDLDITAKILSIIKGDATSYNVAAASILAKVYRDRLMKQIALEYPEYGFDKHKGYGTAMHIKAIKEFGKTRHHRNSFLKNILGGDA